VSLERLEHAFQAICDRDRSILATVESRKSAVTKSITASEKALKRTTSGNFDSFETLLADTALAQREKQRLLALRSEFRRLEAQSCEARSVLRKSFGKLNAVRSLRKLQSSS